MLNNLIYDRTLADVKRFEELRNKGYSNMTAEEQAEWDAGKMKGAYNVGDLNRVGAALNYVRDCLALAGYIAADAFTARENWTFADIPTAAELSYYINCVEMIRKVMATYSTTPGTPEQTGGLDYIDANNIEKILFDVDELITKMLAVRHFCGELYCGEV